jgi:hypothetical protein
MAAGESFYSSPINPSTIGEMAADPASVAFFGQVDLVGPDPVATMRAMMAGAIGRASGADVQAIAYMAGLAVAHYGPEHVEGLLDVVASGRDFFQLQAL